MAGIATLIGLVGKEVLLTAEKLGIAVGVPATKLYWFGLLVVAVYGILKLVAVVFTELIVPSAMVGIAFTEPLTNTFLVEAPVLAQLMLPLGFPVALAATRT